MPFWSVSNQNQKVRIATRNKQTHARTLSVNEWLFFALELKSIFEGRQKWGRGSREGELLERCLCFLAERRLGGFTEMRGWTDWNLAKSSIPGRFGVWPRIFFMFSSNPWKHELCGCRLAIDLPSGLFDWIVVTYYSLVNYHYGSGPDSEWGTIVKYLPKIATYWLIEIVVNHRWISDSNILFTFHFDDNLVAQLALISHFNYVPEFDGSFTEWVECY